MNLFHHIVCRRVEANGLSSETGILMLDSRTRKNGSFMGLGGIVTKQLSRGTIKRIYYLDYVYFSHLLKKCRSQRRDINNKNNMGKWIRPSDCNEKKRQTSCRAGTELMVTRSFRWYSLNTVNSVKDTPELGKVIIPGVGGASEYVIDDRLMFNTVEFVPPINVSLVN